MTEDQLKEGNRLMQEKQSLKQELESCKRRLFLLPDSTRNQIKIFISYLEERIKNIEERFTNV